MSLGTPSYLQEGDLLIAKSGAMAPAGLVLTGTYIFDKGVGPYDSNSTSGTVNLILYGADGSAGRMALTAVGNTNGNSFTCYSYDNTRAAPAVSVDAAAFFSFAVRGYGGAANTYPTGGSFSAIVDGAWSGANQGTYWEWKGTSNGSTTITQWMTLRNAAMTLAGTTDSTSATTGTCIVSGGIAAAKNVIVGKALGIGITSTATAAGTTTLDTTSTTIQVFTGTSTQTVVLPAANLFGAGIAVIFIIKNRSTGAVTISRAGADTIDGLTSIVLAGGTLPSVTLASDGVSAWEII